MGKNDLRTAMKVYYICLNIFLTSKLCTHMLVCVFVSAYRTRIFLIMYRAHH